MWYVVGLGTTGIPLKSQGMEHASALQHAALSSELLKKANKLIKDQEKKTGQVQVVEHCACLRQWRVMVV
jgi:hypothetical protein